MARKTVADIPSATRYSFLSFTCVTLFSNDVVNILKIYQTRHVSKGKQGNRRLHITHAVHSRHPFPLIGDVAYRQHAGGGPSHGHRQHTYRIW